MVLPIDPSSLTSSSCRVDVCADPDGDGSISVRLTGLDGRALTGWHGVSVSRSGFVTVADTGSLLAWDGVPGRSYEASETKRLADVRYQAALPAWVAVHVREYV